jgi:hypothetical protein
MKDDLIPIYVEACMGNVDALAWLTCWHAYAHAVDDLIDEQFTPEGLMEVLSQATCLYSTPFWIQNSARLGGVMQIIGNTYLDSVHWEKSDQEWKRKVADVIRLVGNDMVVAVAQIVGGWQHGRRISERMREFAWHSQHPGETYG